MKTVAIKGFGRIGRCFLRMLFSKNQSSFIVTNIVEKTLDINACAYLLKYDSSYGESDFEVEIKKNILILSQNGKTWRIQVFKSEKNISADVCLDASGSEKKADCQCNSYSFIIYTYFVKDVDGYFLGNKVISKINKPKTLFGGICDSVSLVPILLKVNPCDIERIYIVTMHPFLAYQNLLDGPSFDKEQIQVGRSSFNNVIPKQSTVLSILYYLVPYFKEKIIFNTYRIPTNVVTTCDINIQFKHNIDDEIIECIKNEIEVLKKDELPHVSLDFVRLENEVYGIDATCSSIINKNLHLTLFYNNELTYVNYLYRMMLVLFGIDNQ